MYDITHWNKGNFWLKHVIKDVVYKLVIFVSCLQCVVCSELFILLSTIAYTNSLFFNPWITLLVDYKLIWGSIWVILFGFHLGDRLNVKTASKTVEGLSKMGYALKNVKSIGDVKMAGRSSDKYVAMSDSRGPGNATSF